MTVPPQIPPQIPPEEPPHDSRKAALLGLLVVVVLVVIGVYVTSSLRATGQLQDCVMSGRTNCAPIAVPPAHR